MQWLIAYLIVGFLVALLINYCNDRGYVDERINGVKLHGLLALAVLLWPLFLCMFRVRIDEEPW